MIGKGAILYDVTAGEVLAPVSAIGRLDFERTEISTTTHGPRKRQTSGIGLKRSAPVTIRLNYRANAVAVRRLNSISRQICKIVLIFPDHSAMLVQAFVAWDETPIDGLIHRSFRF